jgi:putative NADH-flavin reductase
VRALVRPSSHCEPRQGLEVLRGSLDSSSDVQATVGEAEVVLCVFGPRSTRSAPFCADATRRIVAVMTAGGPARLICQTGAMAGDLPPNVSPAMRLMAALYRRQCPELAADVAAQERAVTGSGLDWTLVKPPRLASGPATHRTRAGPTLRVGLLSHISRSDLAAFLLEEAAAARHLRQRVYVRG